MQQSGGLKSVGYTVGKKGEFWNGRDLSKNKRQEITKLSVLDLGTGIQLLTSVIYWPRGERPAMIIPTATATNQPRQRPPIIRRGIGMAPQEHVRGACSQPAYGFS
jgi:hypothetical protein